MSPVTPMLSSAGDPDILREQIHNPNLSEEQKIEFAARQFESVLLNLYLKDAMKPLLHQMSGSASSGQLYQHYMTSVLADSVTQGGGLGFTSIIQQQLTLNPEPDSASPNEPDS